MKSMDKEMLRYSCIICAVMIILVALFQEGQGAELDELGNNDDQGEIYGSTKKDSAASSPIMPNGGSTTRKQTPGTTVATPSATCGTPPPDACAYINVDQKDAPRSVASYTCKSPYTLTGQQSLVCNGTGTWDRVTVTDDWPSCKVDCGPAPYEPMTSISATGYGSYNLKVPWVTFVCSPGYSSVDSPSNAKNVTCDPYTLEWERSDLLCVAALQKEMSAGLTFSDNPSLLLDGKSYTCVSFPDNGSAIITFDAAKVLYNITLRANSYGDVSLKVTLKNIDIETENWSETRVPSSEWTNGKVLPWTDRGRPLVGTSLTITITLLESLYSTKFSLCEVEVTGRPHLVACSTPQSPRYGQQLKGVSSERCTHDSGFCSLGTQAEFECQTGFIQTGGQAVIECGEDGNWSNLTLQCAYAPVVNVLQDVSDKKCEAVTKASTIFTVEQVELQYAVVNISVDDSPNARLWIENSRVIFEYVMDVDKYVACVDYNLTIGTLLYAFDCAKRPVAKSVRLRFTNSNILPDISICFIKVVVRNYDKALECVQETALDYKGYLNYAYTGETCDFWTSHYLANETIKGESLENAANFCRNRGNNRPTPWCYINTTTKACAVVMCNQACVLPWSTNGAEYVGQQDFEMETAMSWKCIGWNETTQADVCPVLQKSMYVDSNSDTSYCRNPDRRSSGPWCNTRPCLQGSCSVREMSCRIPTCPNTDQIQNGTINVLNHTEKLWFLTTPMVECWVYTNGSMTRYRMPHVQPPSIEAINTILYNWCDMNNDHNFLATCHNSTNWHRLMLICEMNISSSVVWSSSITPTMLTQDISSSFFIKETSTKDTLISTKDTLILPSTVLIISETQEFAISDNWFTHSTEPTQTDTNLEATTALQGGFGPSLSVVYEYIPTHTTTIPSQMITLHHGVNLNSTTELESTETVVHPGPMITLQSGFRQSSSSANNRVSAQTSIPVQTITLHTVIKVNSGTELNPTENAESMTLQREIKPSASFTYKALSTQTLSVSLDQTTLKQEINKGSTTEANVQQNTTPENRVQTTAQIGTTKTSSTPTYERKTPKNHCPCWCSSDKSTESLEESATKAAKLSQSLQVNKTHLSSVINGKISKNDKRASVTVLSSVFAIGILIVFLLLIVLPDILSAIICILHRGKSYELASAPES